MMNFQDAAEALISVGRHSAGYGWTPATSGNFSARLSDDEVAITVSGAHKHHLTVADIMRVGLDGRPLEDRQPSAETLLHVQLYRRDPAIGVVLHTHSVNATVVSQVTGDGLTFEGLEMLKAFAGTTTHEVGLTLPVFENHQDMARLAQRVSERLDARPALPGYLIAGHGLYAWGATVDDALRHLEAFEFLFQYMLERWRISK